MALNAKEVKGKGAPALEAGVYPARIVQVIDLGLQPGGEYQGKQKEPVNKILLTYELSDEFLMGENDEPDRTKPRWVSESFPLHNLKAENAKSTKRIKAIDPANKFDGDWAKAIGTAVNVTLVINERNGKRYNNVSALSVPRTKELANWPQLVNKPVVFDLSAPDLEVFNSLPDWIKTLITSNLEFAGSDLQRMLAGEGTSVSSRPAPRTQSVADDLDDEIPF